MIPCPACARHVRVADASCVHCGATRLTSLRNSVAGALLGLSVACVGTTTKDTTTETGDPDGTTTAQPAYGVSTTTVDDLTYQDDSIDYADSSDADTDVDADSDVDADTDSDTDTDGTGTGGTGNVADSGTSTGSTGGTGSSTGGRDTGGTSTGGRDTGLVRDTGGIGTDTGGPIIQPLYGVVPTPF